MTVRLPRQSLRPLVIPLDGRSYRVSYKPKTIRALEVERGKSFEQIILGASQQNIRDLIALVKAGLQTHHAEEFPDSASVTRFIDKVMRDPAAMKGMGKMWAH